jgi:hypothetical protein
MTFHTFVYATVCAPAQTGEMSWRKKPYEQGVANHFDPVLYRNSSQELSKDFWMMRRFGWRDLIGKLAQHWVFSPEFPSVIAP